MTSWRSLARSKRVLDAGAVFLAGVMVASGAGLVRAVTVRADDGPPGAFGAVSPNADVVACGADVVLLADAGPDATAGAGPATTAEAVRALGHSLSGTGARLAIVSAGPAATVLTGPAAPADPFAAFVTVDPAANAAGGAIAAAAATIAAAAPAAGPGDWDAGQRAAAQLASRARPDHPLVVVHLVAGLPGQHQGSAAGDEPVAEGTAAEHVAHAVIAANAVKARSGTHLVAVGVGAGSALLPELAALSGPDLVGAGSGPIAAGSTDVVTVPEWAGLPAALAQLGASGCAASVRFNLLADSADGTTVPKPVAPLLAELVGGGSAHFAPDATDPLGGEAVVSRPVTTDRAGSAAVRLVVPADAAVDLVLSEPGVASDQRYAMVCGAQGVPVATDTTNPAVVARGIAAGADITCDLRSLGAGSPLALAHTVLAGADRACADAVEGHDEVVVERLGAAVTHCLTVANVGTAPIGSVLVTSDALGLTDHQAWALDGPLLPGTAASRRVAATVTAAGDVTSGASAVRLAADGGPLAGAAALHADNRATIGVVPAAISVRRGLAVGGGNPCTDHGPAVAPGSLAAYCFTVTNTGGTYLDGVTISDPTLGVADLAVAGPLAPGESATVTGMAPVGDTTAGPTTARGRPVDAGGQTTGAVVTSSAAGLQVTQVMGTPGVDGVVVVGITVTNPGGPPATGVTASSSACATPVTGPQRISDDGDDALEAGEAWVFSCEVAADNAGFSTAFVAAAQTDPTETTVTIPGRTTTDLRIQKRQLGDLKVTGTTTYQIRVTNNGDVTSVNTVVTDPLPSQLSFVSVSSDRGSCTQAQLVVCSLGDIAPAENQEIHATITITVRALPGNGGTTVINQATVTSDTRDYDGSDNVANAYGTIPPDLDPSFCERDCTPTSGGSGGSGAGSGEGGSDDPGEEPDASAVRGALATTGANTDGVVAMSTILLASGLGLLTVGRRRAELMAALVSAPV